MNKQENDIIMKYANALHIRFRRLHCKDCNDKSKGQIGVIDGKCYCKRLNDFINKEVNKQFPIDYKKIKENIGLLK